MEDAGVQRGIWDGDAKTVQQCLTDIFTSVYTTCDIPENAIFGPCVLSHTSLYDSIAFIALKSTDKRTVPYIFRVRAARMPGKVSRPAAGEPAWPAAAGRPDGRCPSTSSLRSASLSGRPLLAMALLSLAGPSAVGMLSPAAPAGCSALHNPIPSVHAGLLKWGLQVDTSAANGSSEGLMWLRLVQSAREREEQNLEAYIKSGQLFYRSLRRIAKDEELLVWYGKELTELLLLSPARAPARSNGGCPSRPPRVPFPRPRVTRGRRGGVEKGGCAGSPARHDGERRPASGHLPPYLSLISQGSVVAGPG